MKPKQPFIYEKERGVSEISILLVSFVTAFSAGIIVISALFVAAKKLENKVGMTSDVTFSVLK